MIGWKLTREDTGSLTEQYGRVYYREGEEFAAPDGSLGCYVGLTLAGVLRGGYGPRLVAVEYDILDDLGGGSGDHDRDVRRVSRGRVLPEWPSERPRWTEAWSPTGSAEEAEAFRRLLALGDAESLRCVAGCAPCGSAEQVEALRRLLALGDAESLRVVALWAPDGSAEEAEAFRRLLALGDATSLRVVAQCAPRGSAERAEAIRRMEVTPK